jgi:hypothetical protein
MFLMRRSPLRLWPWYLRDRKPREQQLPWNDENNDNDNNDNANNINNDDDHNNESHDNDNENNNDNDDGDKDYTPSSDVENERMYHDADQIKTFGNETLIPTDRLQDLLGHISITTTPEFRIKRIPCLGREEYRVVVEVFNGPNVML